VAMNTADPRSTRAPPSFAATYQSAAGAMS
jgi:hypothetical protein